ncbi:MAG: ParB/RepB/Spo0J family partition protein [Deltaproteobacteria bacterium]|nr:ParB/RepB/Spo0J family partition protein [Deltaproteobacteria bacterium]
MQQQRKALGKGLASLISPEVIPMPETTNGPTFISVDSIFANRQQPRHEFDDEAIKDLAESIKREGVLQPLIVCPSMDGRFELIAGERRWRASKLAGLTQVPVIIKSVQDDKMLELAMVENIQRQNLNAMEESKGYQAMVDRFQISHADIAERVGKSREHVANSLRLLRLPKIVQDDISAGRMTAGHARALLSLASLQDQLHFRERILEETLSVRDVEKLIQERGGVRKKNQRGPRKNLSPQIKLLLDEMEKSLGTRVRLQMGAIEGRGSVVIEYYSWQDLDRVYKKIKT